MSDDLNKKIKQITDMLGQDSLPDNIKGLLSLLGNSGAKEDATPPSTSSAGPRTERAEKSDLEENVEMIRKVKKVMDRLNNNSDPRVHLLTAIKPFLNNTRQKRLGNCIKILQMSSLTSFMDDHDTSKS